MNYIINSFEVLVYLSKEFVAFGSQEYILCEVNMPFFEWLSAFDSWDQ